MTAVEKKKKTQITHTSTEDVLRKATIYIFADEHVIEICEHQLGVCFEVINLCGMQLVA